MRSLLRMGVVVGGLVVLTACSPTAASNSHSAATLATSPSPSAGIGGAPGAAAQASLNGQASTGKAGQSPGASGGTAGSASAAGSPRPHASPPPPQVTMSPACVRSGAPETITVKTLEKSAVGFNTYYSDGKYGGSMQTGPHYGGNAGGETDSRGVYTFTWTISPQAPAGAVRVDVVDGTPDGIVNATSKFTIANLQGSC